MQNWGVLSAETANEIAKWIGGIPVLTNIITGSFVFMDIPMALAYILLLTGGAVLFSLFWVQTSGQDASSVAKQIKKAGLHIAGFRTDEKILEKVLKRYIFPLTIMGGMAVGILAATADLLGALSRGTGILLAVMIIYRMYEDIAKQHMMDMNPAMRKIMGGG